MIVYRILIYINPVHSLLVNKLIYHFYFFTLNPFLITDLIINMELYEIWKNRAEQHDYEAHQLRQWKYIEDPSCYICHPWRNEDHIGDELEKQFLIFWEYYQPMFDAKIYTWKTIQNFGSLLLIEPDVSKHICDGTIENEEPQRQLQKMHENVKALIGSIRYDKAPNVNVSQMISSTVRMIAIINQMREEEEGLQERLDV